MTATKPELAGKLLFDAPMARYSSWRAGGAAKLLFMPADAQDLVAFWSQYGLDRQVHFIGLGSNLLVRDGGVKEPVVRLAPGLKKLEKKGEGLIYAEAGVAMPKLAKFATANQLGQAGFMAGIPGSVGGALAMNAGCFGSEVWERVAEVTLIDDHGKLVTLPADEFNFGYRTVSHPKLKILRFVAASFVLNPLLPEEEETNRTIMEKREAAQPIGKANAGSVFLNPPDDSAGRLIEELGLASYTIGGAQISPKHCNFIVNVGDATAADIEKLIGYVQQQVNAKFNISLVPEVRIIGVSA